MAAELTAGAGGGAASPGQPNSQAAPITSAAAQAPDTADMTVEEIAARQADCDDRPGAASAAAPSFWVSPETSVASRSMVGGARLARPASGGGSISSGLSSAISGSLLLRQIRQGPRFDRTRNRGPNLLF